MGRSGDETFTHCRSHISEQSHNSCQTPHKKNVLPGWYVKNRLHKLPNQGCKIRTTSFFSHGSERTKSCVLAQYVQALSKKAEEGVKVRAAQRQREVAETLSGGFLERGTWFADSAPRQQLFNPAGYTCFGSRMGRMVKESRWGRGKGRGTGLGGGGGGKIRCSVVFCDLDPKILSISDVMFQLLEPWGAIKYSTAKRFLCRSYWRFILYKSMSVRAVKRWKIGNLENIHVNLTQEFGELSLLLL